MVSIMKSEKPGTTKPRNRSATSPLLKKGHIHPSDRDYNRNREKRRLRDEVDRRGTR